MFVCVCTKLVGKGLCVIRFVFFSSVSPFIYLVQANLLLYFIIIFLHGRKSDSFFLFFSDALARPDTRTRAYTSVHRTHNIIILYTSHNYYFASFPTENHRTGTIHFTTRVHNYDNNNDVLCGQTVSVDRCFIIIIFFSRTQT